MPRKIQRRYFAVLLFPPLLTLLLALCLTLYTHIQGTTAIQQDVEKSCIRMTDSVAKNMDTLMNQARINASNLAVQLSKTGAYTAFPNALYHATVDQLASLQLNTESMLNPLIGRGYIFLFDENRAISLSSTLHDAASLYQNYFRVGNSDYASYKEAMRSCYYAGELLPEVEIGYLDETYHAWLIAQTIPADPTMTPTGLILFTLDEAAMRQRLTEGLADVDSLCLLLADDQRMVVQGGSGLWDDSAVDNLLAQLPEDAGSSCIITMANGARMLVTVANTTVCQVIAAQPLGNAFSSVLAFNRSILLLTSGILLIAVLVIVLFTRRHMHSARNVIDTVSPQHSSDSAISVFDFMEKAIRSSQENEALLAAHAGQQQALLQRIFLKRLMRGEFAAESERVREQLAAGVTLEAACYTVVLIHFWPPQQPDVQALVAIDEVMRGEFGAQQALLCDMGPEDVACLLLSADEDLHDSIDAVAEVLTARYSVTFFAGGTVHKPSSIARSYREAHSMAHTAREFCTPVCWYSEFFHDNALYNSEYSRFSEQKLGNCIAAGNLQETTDILDSLYRHVMRSTPQTSHVLRFAAFDLYRLANRIVSCGTDSDRAAWLMRLQDQLDSVLERPQTFDAFFDEVKRYCLEICVQNTPRRQSAGDSLIQQVTQYIDQHFTNPDLTVGSIAQAFSLSDKYLSQLFREQTGERLSNYMEELRLRRACDLLETTDLTINEVATASGYALTHTFRVAFKKTQGVTPLQWRSAHRGG